MALPNVSEVFNEGMWTQKEYYPTVIKHMDRHYRMNKLFLLTISFCLCLVLSGCNEKQQSKQDYSMTTKYYKGLNLHRYGTNASWVDEELEIKEAYLGAMKRAKYIKIESNMASSIILVEAWEQSFNEERAPNFNIENLKEETFYYFIKKSEAFKRISNLETETYLQYYEYDRTEPKGSSENKDFITLKSIKRSILYRTEYQYDSQNNHIKTCHYDRNINGNEIVMDNCKKILFPRKLDDGEIPDFPM